MPNDNENINNSNIARLYCITQLVNNYK